MITRAMAPGTAPAQRRHTGLRQALAPLALLLCAHSAVPAFGQRVDLALTQTVASHDAARAVQVEIDRLAGALSWAQNSREERALLERMRQMQEQIARIDARIAASEDRRSRQRQTEAAMLPLMERMLETLDDLIDADLPFDTDRRHADVRSARAALRQHDLSMADRYAAVLESWLREVGYGYNSALGAADVTVDGTERRVRQVRIGRSALYYVSNDGLECGLWLRATGRYAALAPADCRLLADLREEDDLVSLLTALPLDGEAPR